MIQEISCNPLTNKDLLAELGNSSYYHGVTVDEFWRVVGARLAERRKAKGMSMAAVDQNGGPTNKTVQDIEAGDIRQLSKLRDYADKLGVDLIDVFRSVLQADEEEQSEELQFVIRQFNSRKSVQIRHRQQRPPAARRCHEKHLAQKLQLRSDAGRNSATTPGRHDNRSERGATQQLKNADEIVIRRRTTPRNDENCQRVDSLGSWSDRAGHKERLWKS